MTTAPISFGEVALPLHRQGWRPIPLRADTKQPAEGGWDARNRTPWPERELQLAVVHHREAACGIALPDDLLALDMDVEDPQAAARLEEAVASHLGETPLVRIGNPPKSVRIYRSDGSIRSAKPHPVELYAGSGQVAVYGWHAKAGKPYTWPRLSPLQLGPDSPSIPLVTATEMGAFLRDMEPVLRGLRQTRGRAAGGLGRDAGDQLGRMLRSRVPFHVAARLVLEGAAEGGRHYAVRAVVSAGYNWGIDADRIERAIRRAAPPELLEHVGDYVERVLRDFAPRELGPWK